MFKKFMDINPEVEKALEEGMNVIGTYEAGASAAILPRERLYHAGDVIVLDIYNRCMI